MIDRLLAGFESEGYGTSPSGGRGHVSGQGKGHRAGAVFRVGSLD